MPERPLDYVPLPPSAGRTSPLAVLACAASLAALPCCTGVFVILPLVPADVFNSVDLRYRALFWNAVTVVPSLGTLSLSGYAGHRVRRSHGVLRGMAWAVAGMIVSLLWTIAGLLGLGLFMVD